MFRKAHEECERKHRIEQCELEIVITITSGGDLLQARQRCERIADGGPVNCGLIPGLIVDGWSAAFDDFLEDGPFLPEQQVRLQYAAQMLQISPQALQALNISQRLQDAQVRHQQMQLVATAYNAVQNGRLPVYPYVLPQPFPFVLQRSEQFIWLFGSVNYAQEKVKREYISGSTGVSVRVAKGMTVRTGATRGYSVEHRVFEPTGSGLLCFTTKHIAFSSSTANLRVPWSKLVSIQPFSDAIVITKEAANPKQQVFTLEEAAFAYQLAMLLAA